MSGSKPPRSAHPPGDPMPEMADLYSDSEKGNPYAAGLAAFGAGLAAFSWYLLQSTPMTALGIGVAVVGASIAITPTAPVPSKAVRKLLEGSLANIEAVLEDTGAAGRGYYVPGGAVGGSGDGGAEAGPGAVRVFVPIGGGGDAGSGSGALPSRWEAKGLVTSLDGRDYLVLYPPGSFLVSNEGMSGDLESLLGELLVEESGIVESVKVVEDGQSVVVDLKRPRSGAGYGRVRRALGSLEAGTAAVVVAAAKKRVAMVASEEDLSDRKRVVIDLL